MSGCTHEGVRASRTCMRECVFMHMCACERIWSVVYYRDLYEKVLDKFTCILPLIQASRSTNEHRSFSKNTFQNIAGI